MPWSRTAQPKLRAVATDGRRLALAEMPAPEGCVGAPGVIIPRKTIDEVRRLLDDAGETRRRWRSAPQKVRFGFGRAALTSKVIDGSFPPYERVIPREQQAGDDARQRPVRRRRRPGGHHLHRAEPGGEAVGRDAAR